MHTAAAFAWLLTPVVSGGVSRGVCRVGVADQSFADLEAHGFHRVGFGAELGEHLQRLARVVDDQFAVSPVPPRRRAQHPHEFVQHVVDRHGSVAGD